MVLFGTSSETGDFWVDCLEYWWEKTKGKCGRVRRLVIRLDNGPVNASDRKLFLKRLVAFARRTTLEIHLVYYPPYHSKYNPIERVWGILEEHWNGHLLVSRQTVLRLASTMTYNGLSPIVTFIDKIYQTGVRLSQQAMLALEKRLCRLPTLPRWFVKIVPHPR